MLYAILITVLALSSTLANSPWDPREEEKVETPCDPCVPDDELDDLG